MPEETIKCPKCGTKNSINDTFCKECGNKLLLTYNVQENSVKTSIDDCYADSSVCNNIFSIIKILIFSGILVYFLCRGYNAIFERFLENDGIQPFVYGMAVFMAVSFVILVIYAEVIICKQNNIEAKIEKLLKK